MEIAGFPLGTRRLPSLVVCLAAMIGCLLQIPVSAQDQAQDAIRVDVNLVMIDATVKSKAGQIMADLKKGDFELREDGSAKKVEVFSREDLRLHGGLGFGLRHCL